MTKMLCCQVLTVTTVVLKHQHLKVKVSSSITGQEWQEGE